MKSGDRKRRLVMPLIKVAWNHLTRVSGLKLLRSDFISLMSLIRISERMSMVSNRWFGQLVRIGWSQTPKLFKIT